MCPYSYYNAMRDGKDPRCLRLEMVRYVERHGVKPAARHFLSTPKTIRKWMRRFDGTLDSLAEESRAPRRRPRKLQPKDEARIVELKKKLPSWGAERLKRGFNPPYSEKAIRRVCRDHKLTRKYRRRRHQTKRCLREIKKQWRFLQQISIDTKDLSDIPEYRPGPASGKLPRYQYTAREVTTGLLFLGFADEPALAYATLFAGRIIKHLLICGQTLVNTTWQSDNGSGFIGSWQAKDDSVFTKAIQEIPGQTHRTIPPGQHRFQADVETVHSLMETELYMIENFSSREDFMAKATSYNLFFNLAGKTP